MEEMGGCVRGDVGKYEGLLFDCSTQLVSSIEHASAECAVDPSELGVELSEVAGRC